MSHQKPIAFTKLVATGNDFIFIDNRKSVIEKKKKKQLAKAVCDNHFGVGADGLVFIEKTTDKAALFGWDFYNSDGSEAAMCGNAARCAGLFATINGLTKKSSFTFLTQAGPVTCEQKTPSIFKVSMPELKVIIEKVKIPSPNWGPVVVSLLNTGVPHAVIEVESWDQGEMSELGEYVRNHEVFEKWGGANVTFVSQDNPTRILSVTYERGVEGLTLSCGTGAVAAALFVAQNQTKKKIRVQVPGGLLEVEFENDLQRAWLTGEASLICDGQYFFSK